MNFHWIRYNGLAQRLINGIAQVEDEEDKQANLRKAVSASYYSAYHLAKQYLIDYELYYPSQLQRESDHTYVRDSFWDKRNHTSNAIAEDLRELRQNRNWCDYDTELDYDIAGLVRLAEHCVGRARRVQVLLERLRAQKK
jgi:uncharacterized protein (UPF0332 family)